MWCSNCQQDVPAIASPEDRQVRCAKCRQEFVRLAPATRRTEDDRKIGGDLPEDGKSTRQNKTPAGLDAPPFDLDAFDWDELREAHRVIRTWGGMPARDSHSTSLAGTVRPPVHMARPHPVRSAQDESSAEKRSAGRKRTKTLASRPFAFVSWIALSLGLMAFVFGGVLLAWSFASDRADLWNIGLPFTIGGQLALVLGLVLQLDRLWQSSHSTAETLSELDEQMMELRRATSQISSSHSGPGQSFYFHLAEGCSPHMLLADLKGQLDLLAMRIADHK